MKIIGKAKGKKSPSWCLIRDTRTGVVYQNYVGNWPVSGKQEEVEKAIAEAVANRYAEPVIPPQPPHPGFYKWEMERRGVKMTQEQQDAWELREAYDKANYAHRIWTEKENLAHLEVVDINSIFEAELRFVGYTRGRSSVTMKFEGENGQEVEFGPSGISGLIQGIIDGECVSIPLSGTYEEREWDRVKEEWVDHTKPRGQGIKAIFKFTKKGENVYAELTEV